jgi:N-acetylmuramoyl-L-alanine amidase
MRNYLPLLIVCLLMLTITACSKYAATNRSYKKQSRNYAKTLREQPNSVRTDSGDIPSWTGTINFNMRKPNFVIIHHTAQNTCEQTLETFTKTSTQVSAHYVICRNGTVYHMLNDYLRAWHAGAGRWGNVTDMNSCSIGIELDNNGFEPFSAAQLSSLLTLLDTLKKKYSIPAANFIGHADIAPTRKNDPNVRFPWKDFAAKGFGIWYGDTTKINVPADFNSLQGLRIIGYDVRDSNAAIIAFKRHFMQDTVTKKMGEGDRKVVYGLLTP